MIIQYLFVQYCIYRIYLQDVIQMYSCLFEHRIRNFNRYLVKSTFHMLFRYIRLFYTRLSPVYEFFNVLQNWFSAEGFRYM